MAKLKDDTENLFFLAIIPPTPVLDEVWKMKQYFKENYHSKAALNSPPHITLHMPFRWKVEKENILVQKVTDFVRKFHPVKVCLDNFGAFPPRVIFINVAGSEMLEHLEKEVHRFCKTALNLFNARYKDEPFHPHVTLAFRDLKKNVFKTAWEEFSTKEYKAEFMADKIALLKHDGKKWNVFREFNLESSYSTDHKGMLATTEG